MEKQGKHPASPESPSELPPPPLENLEISGSLLIQESSGKNRSEFKNYSGEMMLSSQIVTALLV